DSAQGHKMEKLTKAVDILQKEINLLKGDKKLNAVKEKAKPDFLDLDKDGNKKEPMKKAVKDKKKVEAYSPETGRDPNHPTPEWDELIAKAKKKQGISDEEEVWFNYEDIGGNIIVNPKSTIEDQIGELLNRYYDISPMEFDPSKIEITTPDQTNQDANFAKTQNARNTPKESVKEKGFIGDGPGGPKVKGLKLIPRIDKTKPLIHKPIKTPKSGYHSNNTTGYAEAEEKKEDLLKGFDPKTARAIMMLKAKYPQADNILSALLADVENNEKDGDVVDLSQDYKMEKLTKAVDILRKEISLLKGDKK
ncbi:uncharacterized protein METZ01_LOCUS367884, partial [marine metagenome]